MFLPKYYNNSLMWAIEQTIKNNQEQTDYFNQIAWTIEDCINNSTQEFENYDEMFNNFLKDFYRNFDERNEDSNMKQKTNYTNFKSLFHDAFIALYDNKNKFFDDRFIRDLIEKVESSGQPADIKKSTYQYVLSDWENFFHDNRLSVAEALINKSLEICDETNLKKLVQNDDALEWFSNKNDDFFDCSEYEEPFQLKHILELLSDEEIKKYELVKDENELSINFFLNHKYENIGFLDIANPKNIIKSHCDLAFSDSRWYLISNQNDYEKFQKEWNEDILNGIELSKQAYHNFKTHMSQSRSGQ